MRQGRPKDVSRDSLLGDQHVPDGEGVVEWASREAHKA